MNMMAPRVSRNTDNPSYAGHIRRYNEIRDSDLAKQLQADLKMHVYKEVGKR